MDNLLAVGVVAIDEIPDFRRKGEESKRFVAMVALQRESRLREERLVDWLRQTRTTARREGSSDPER